MTFLELAEKVLSEQTHPISVQEIWTYACEKGYDKQLGGKGKTPTATLGAIIYVSTRDNIKTPFAHIGERPKLFYLKSKENQIDFKDNGGEPRVKPKGKLTYYEKDLHPLLTWYANSYLRCYTKTISDKSSSKKDYGEWTHPDIVGCYLPFDDWKSEVYEFSASVGHTSVKLFSFELKRELNFGNLRASFFQSVSNSSWANEGYLVASEISEEPDFLSELGRLSNSFGIGVIRLNVEEPYSSEIIFPAKEREVLDWEMINKLTKMNTDFRSFINRMKVDIRSTIVHRKEYDEVLDVEKLKSLFKS